jgi:hypothetical protein
LSFRGSSNKKPPAAAATRGLDFKTQYLHSQLFPPPQLFLFDFEVNPRLRFAASLVAAANLFGKIGCTDLCEQRVASSIAKRAVISDDFDSIGSHRVRVQDDLLIGSACVFGCSDEGRASVQVHVVVERQVGHRDFDAALGGAVRESEPVNVRYCADFGGDCRASRDDFRSAAGVVGFVVVGASIAAGGGESCCRGVRAGAAWAGCPNLELVRSASRQTSQVVRSAGESTDGCPSRAAAQFVLQSVGSGGGDCAPIQCG